MLSSSETNSYVELSRNFDSVLRWLISLGINAKAGRIAFYARRLNELSRSQLSQNYDNYELTNSLADFVNVAHEISIWLHIYKNFKNETAPAFVEVLRRASVGVTHSAEEPVDGSSRDFTFELYSASFFQSAGYKLTWNEDLNAADIVACIDGQTVFAECKRPRSETNVRTNISKALSQLDKRYLNEPKAFGVGIIALERVLNSGLTVSNATDMHQANRLVSNELSNAATRYSEFWIKKRLNDSTLGLIFFLNMPVVVGSSKTLFNVHNSILWQFGVKEFEQVSPRGHTFMKIGKALFYK